MINILFPDRIVLDAQAGTREEAIRMVGTVLVERGHADVGYVAAMFERENKGSTFAGNGVAFPHAKQAVKMPGIAMLQIPGGVDWDGAVVYLVFGIASSPHDQGNFPVTTLARLCENSVKVERIRYAATAEEIVLLLEAEASDA